LAGAEKIFEFDIGVTDTYLAYLPLAHILEFMVETHNIYRGIRMGYGSPKTLTDKSMLNSDGSTGTGDISELGPTFFAGVPTVWETIRKGVLAKVEAEGKTKIFSAALKMKSWLNKNGYVLTLF
jgi:long-chain acyl-CoA synthetase